MHSAKKAFHDFVDATRIHYQWLPDEVYYETHGLSPNAVNMFDGMGYNMKQQTS